MSRLSSLGAKRSQRGIAAIEFALVFSMLLLFLYGIVTFGSVLYTQQAVSRSAEDGARALTSFNGPLTPSAISDVTGVVYDSLSTSLVGPCGPERRGQPTCTSTTTANWLWKCRGRTAFF